MFRVVIYDIRLCSYAVMQFKMRGVIRDEKNFYYIYLIIYIITIYLVRKAPKIGKRAKNNCITV